MNTGPQKSIKLTKASLRSKILKELNTQKEEQRARKSRTIQRRLFALSVFKKAKTVMFYIPLRGEVDTNRMISLAQKLGKIVAVPVLLKGRRMLPALFMPEDRHVRGPYGTYEPAVKRFLKVKDIDLVIVPAVAFDPDGNRLGRGRGCYDYFLKRISRDTSSVGLAFRRQILPALPATSSDVKVQTLVFA